MLKTIEIKNLLLDENNPRLENIEGQDDALVKIIEAQGIKLVNLASDIVEMGATNPSELPIVMSSNEGSGKYVVLEGNRRVTVLKLFLNEEKLELIKNSSHKNKFLALRSQFLKKTIDSLECYVANTKEDADHWRKLRHTGENDGVGLIRWDAAAVARFNQQQGVTGFNTIAIQVVEQLKKSPSTPATVKPKLDNLAITNLARLVNDPAVRKAIGLKVEKKVVDSNQNKETIKKLGTIVNKITTNDFSVQQIYNKDNRQDFIEQTFGTTETTTGSTSEKPTSTAKKDDSTNKTKKSKPESTKRVNLIPSSTVLKIDHPRLNKIYRELKNLRVDDFENSVAVMLRVFVELSIDEYSDKNKVHGYNINSDLKNKIKAVANHLEKNNILEKNQLKAIRVSIDNPHDLFAVNTLNAYIHNKEFEPKSKDLKLTWNNIEAFVVKLWE